jgi:calcineurin-like phosphoesterase family protein
MKDAESLGFEDALKKAAAIQKDVEEMNNTMVRNWNNIVSPNDTVYHLGDFAFAARAVEVFTPLLNGKKILITGNHDFPHPSHRKSRRPENQAKWIEMYKSWGWHDVKLSDTLRVPGVATFNLHHIPYSSGYTAADEEDRQYKIQKYAAKDDQLPLLCGHVHEKWSVKRTPSGTIMINVGVDSPNMPWSKQLRPASLEEIVEVYNNEFKRNR